MKSLAPVISQKKSRSRLPAYVCGEGRKLAEESFMRQTIINKIENKNYFHGDFGGSWVERGGT
jgi:hypothetical protein